MFSPFFFSELNLQAIMRTFILLIFVSFFLHSCASLFSMRSSKTTLQQDIRTLLDDPNLGNAFLGIYIESLDDGAILFRQNEHKLFVPASNMKLYTTAASLVKLGKDFRFKTVIGTDSSLIDSTLRGNLIIRGSGDPGISGRYFGGKRDSIFKQWADSLLEKGVRRIKGSLIGDNSYFQTDILGDSWNWDDEPFWYSAQPSALSFNDNCVEISAWPGRLPGAPVSVMQSPKINYLEIRNSAVTFPKDSLPHLDISRLRAQNVATVEGALPAGADTVEETISVERPAEYFLRELQAILQEKGITVQGGVEVRNRYVPVSDTLFRHNSATLSALITTVNKKSHNFFAEQLLKTLGARFNGNGSFKGGAGVVANWTRSIGIPPSEFINVDGSGLSRQNFVTPFATVTLLKHLYQYGDFLTFYESLPIAGVDGSLKNRMRHSPAQGNVHAKTGYVRHMRSLSGYVRGKDKRPYVFSIMVNNYSVPTPYINDLQDKICILLSNYKK